MHIEKTKSQLAGQELIRMVRICIVTVLYGIGCSAWAVDDAKKESPAELFKTFLQSPPEMKNITLERIVLEDAPELPEAARAAAKRPQYFEAAWKEKSFYLRRVNDLKDVGSRVTATNSTAGFLFAGRHEQTEWHIVNTNIYYELGVSDSASPSRYVADLPVAAENILNDARYLGIPRIVPGSIVWQGDQFTAKSENGSNLSGTLQSIGGVPSKVSVKSDQPAMEYEVEYGYSAGNALPAALPSTVLRKALQNGKMEPTVKITFLSATLADAPLPEATFNPKAFIDAPTREILHTNNGLYVVSNNTLVKLQRDTELFPEHSHGSKIATVWLVLGAIPVGLIAFGLLLRRQKNRN